MLIFNLNARSTRPLLNAICFFVLFDNNQDIILVYRMPLPDNGFQEWHPLDPASADGTIFVQNEESHSLACTKCITFDKKQITTTSGLCASQARSRNILVLGVRSIHQTSKPETMNDTISTFGLLPARISEHLISQNTKCWINLEYQYGSVTLVLVGLPLLAALAILLRDLSINSFTRAEPEPHLPAPGLRAQAQSHQPARLTGPRCSNIATQTIKIEAPRTSGGDQEEHDHRRVGKPKNDYIQQPAEWVAEREGLRSQLLQARRRIELLLKANQIEVHTRAGGEFLAALEVVGAQEDIAKFSAQEKRKTKASKRKLQLEYNQRLKTDYGCEICHC